ncbi:hypothetical protein B0H13DRAFT_2352815 [Mycena leptocephala]|nr:hypothetical protein B0H13DRAFT_2352815 [Mycena leptocephala]
MSHLNGPSKVVYAAILLALQVAGVARPPHSSPSALTPCPHAGRCSSSARPRTSRTSNALVHLKVANSSPPPLAPQALRYLLFGLTPAEVGGIT